MEKVKTKNREAATTLATALGNLPLALELAAAYTARARLSLAEYFKLFLERDRETAARLSGSEEYPAALATTFDISLRRIETESPASAALLTLCAFLAPDEVPLEIFKEATGHLPPMLSAVAADPEALGRLAATLQEYSLAKVRGGSFISLHHFIQTAARDRLDEDDEKKWTEAAVLLMNAAFPFDNADPQTWPASERLLQHALTAAERARELRVSEESTARLLNESGSYLLNKAEFTRARLAFEQALEIYNSTFGPNHPNVATGLNNLGNVLQELGDIDGARTNYERALAIDEEVYGPEHPRVAIRLNNLGNVLKAQGDLDSARTNYERALAIGEINYGHDHPKVAIRLNNLGSLLKERGDLEGAKEKFVRALAIEETVYGTNHPDVAISLNNLGSVLEDLGDFVGACASYERALRIFREFLGEEHPLTLIVKDNLESLEERGGKVEESE